MEEILASSGYCRKEVGNPDARSCREAQTLRENDILTQYDIDNETHERILAFIHRINCRILSRLYMVKKIISSDICVTAYVLEFKKDADADSCELMMQRLYRYLRGIDGEYLFSIFRFEGDAARAAISVENSLIFEGV